MAMKPHEDSRNVRAVLQPELQPMSNRETEDMRRHDGRRPGSHSGSSSLSPSSHLPDGTSNESGRQRGKGQEDQDMETEPSSGGGYGQARSSPSLHMTLSYQSPYSAQEMWEGKDLENQRMETERGGGQAGLSPHTSMSLVPSNRPMDWDMEDQKMMKQQGWGGDVSHASSSSCPPSSPSARSTQYRNEGLGGTSSSSCRPSSPSGRSTQYRNEGLGGTSSSSCRPSSPSGRSTQYRNEGLGGTGPGRQEMKTQSGSGDHYGAASSSSCRPPSPSGRSTQYRNEGLGGTSSSSCRPPSPSGRSTQYRNEGLGGTSSSSCRPPSPSGRSTQYRNEGLGGTGPGRQETKTQSGSGDHYGAASSSSYRPPSPSGRSTQYRNEGLGGTSSSSCRPPSPSGHSTQYRNEGLGGTGPGRQETKPKSGSGDHYGAGSSSSCRPPSPSTRSTQYRNEGSGGTGPERQETKPKSGSGDHYGAGSPYYTPPSSPPPQQFESEGWEARKPMDEEWKEAGASSCCALTKLKRIQDCRDDLGPLKPSKKHTVLVDSDAFNRERRIVPFEGMHVWNAIFVKLPCAQNTSQGNQDSRWKQIKKQLGLLASKTTVGVREVAETILSFNPKYSGQWSFESLSKFTQSLPRKDNYVYELFPKIAALAMKLPEKVQTAIPLLRAGHVAAVTLSQAQIACLLANAFFCTFPHRNASTPNAEYHNYPSINFSSLFGNRLERKNEKLRAVMHYFKVVTDKRTNLDGLVTFERRLLRDADQPDWRSGSEKINKLYVSSDGHIEKEGSGLLQVDFANSLIGGGVLGSGLVQEEILFIINPELLVSRLFTERLQDNECLIITGSQQFSHYSGYSDTFLWLGACEETLPRDGWSRLQRQIVALDALHYRNWKEQFRMDKIKRELNKAYCGFKGRLHHDDPDIATGKWGCGAFNGDPQLKAVIQLMAAAKAGRGLAFFTFNNKQLERDLQKIHHLLVTKGITVGKLYGLLQDYCTKLQRAQVGLFDFLWGTIASQGPKKHQSSHL